LDGRTGSRAYAELNDLMELAEQFISFIVKRCLEKRRADLQVIGRDVTKLEKSKPPSRACNTTTR
jgi:asparaginyl-tRNA synthetase